MRHRDHRFAAGLILAIGLLLPMTADGQTKLPKKKPDPMPPAKYEPPKDGPYPYLDQVKGDRTLPGMTSALSPDGKQIALFHNPDNKIPQPKYQIVVWDFEQKKVVQRIETGNGLGNRLAWSADGKSLATSMYGLDFLQAKGRNVTVWDTSEWKPKAILDVEGMGDLAISADGSIVAATYGGVGDPAFLALWNVTEKKQLHRIGLVATGTPLVRLTADGKTAFVTGYTKESRLGMLDVSTGKLKQGFPLGNEQLAISADGKTLVVSFTDAPIGAKSKEPTQRLMVYDTAVGVKSGRVIPIADWRIDNIVMLDQGRHWAISGTSEEVQIIELKTGKKVHTIVPAKTFATVFMTATPDSKRLVTMSGDFLTRMFGTPFGGK